MKKTDINKALEQNPNTVFTTNHGFAIIKHVRTDNRGTTRACGQRVYHNIDENGTLNAHISENHNAWTLTQIECVYADNLEHFIQRIADRLARQQQAEQKRIEQRNDARQAEADMQTILNRLGIDWHGARFTSYYNSKCTLEMTPAALAALVAYINEHTQEVTA